MPYVNRMTKKTIEFQNTPLTMILIYIKMKLKKIQSILLGFLIDNNYHYHITGPVHRVPALYKPQKGHA